ncbi:hypothetical protein [Chryseobacterium indoltheticum]|uniref:Uncharacterized protein n=1 Tax=Chryseobacterium indoltheticum TaxID=254 RepID=A0A381FRZ5_9FLAO|nr:hypothetical protein [Chryseobacterium indoltheticum]SUX48961.1 Uncharacterised protein [Chryseobacterium indoltheticum]
MKLKQYIALAYSGIFIISCNNDDVIEDLTGNENLSKVENIAQQNKMQFPKEVQLLKSDKFYKSKEQIVAEFTKTNKRAPILHGPFTYTIRKPAYSTRPGWGNQPFTANIIYNGVGTYPAPGQYVAEIYDYRFNINVPADAFHAFTESIDVIGYSNYTTQTVGYNDQPLSMENGGQYFKVNTYGMILKYNSVGQLLNFPISVTNTKTLTYYYLTL